MLCPTGANYESSRPVLFVIKLDFMFGLVAGSIPPSVSLALVEDSVADKSIPLDCQVTDSRYHNSAPAAESVAQLPINDDSSSPRDIETYPDFELIQNHSPSCISHDLQPQKSPPNLADYSVRHLIN